jgi:GDP-L-fucose synthase
MKILVTGAYGMVGRNIVEEFLRYEYMVYSPSRHELNLLDYKELKNYLRNIQPDLIVNASGRVGGIHANYHNNSLFFLENMQMNMNLIKSSYETSVKKLINIASASVYSVNAINPLVEENLFLGPLEKSNEGYALAKLNSLKLCMFIKEENSDYDYKTLLPCNLYGKWDHFDVKRSHMIASIISKVHNAKKELKKSITIWGDGTARREFMNVEDLVKVIIEGIKNYDLLPSIMNVGTGIDYTISEYYRMIAEIIGIKVDFEYDLDKPVGARQRLLNVSKLLSFGWNKFTPIEEGIRKTYEYFLEGKVCD